MSVYGWERGTIVIPKADYGKFKQGLLEACAKCKDTKIVVEGPKVHIDVGEGDAEIHFNDAGHSVIWDVPENNHAVDRAHEAEAGIAFFRALGRVNWTRGTGGQLIGNDEYNKDAGRDSAGGGGNYVTATYGPAKKGRGVNTDTLRKAIGRANW